MPRVVATASLSSLSGVLRRLGRAELDCDANLPLRNRKPSPANTKSRRWHASPPIPHTPNTRPNLRAELLQVGRRWSVSLTRLVLLGTELDQSGEWALDGSPTCAHWLAAALDVEVGTARDWLRIGRALRTLPLTAAAFTRRRAVVHQGSYDHPGRYGRQRRRAARNRRANAGRSPGHRLGRVVGAPRGRT